MFTYYYFSVVFILLLIIENFDYVILVMSLQKKKLVVGIQISIYN